MSWSRKNSLSLLGFETRTAQLVSNSLTDRAMCNVVTAQIFLVIAQLEAQILFKVFIYL